MTGYILLKNDAEGKVLFFSDNWYPGWTAYVNGSRVPLFVANYTFKGIKLDAPKNSIIEFELNPPIVKVSFFFSGVSLFILTCLLLRYRQRRER